jgi:hypothetical protein
MCLRPSSSDDPGLPCEDLSVLSDLTLTVQKDLSVFSDRVLP